MFEEAVAEAVSILTIDPVHPSETAIAAAVDALYRGEVIIAPTETRYGMLTRGDSKEALTRLFAVKRRPAGLPTAVFLPSAYLIPRYAELSPVAQRLAERFLPGAITLILTARADNNLPVLQGRTIGIRVSSSPVIAAIVEQVDFPVTATSANISGEPECVTIAEIANSFGAEISLYLDAGPLNLPVSTVVDCTQDSIQIIRPGVLAEEIEREANRK